MDERYIKELTETTERSKSNTHRIDGLEKEVKENNMLAINVKELTLEIKHMREDYQKSETKHAEELEKMDNRLAEVESKPVKRYEQVVSLILTRYSYNYTGFFISQNWNVRWYYETSMGRFKKLCNHYNDNCNGLCIGF